MADTRPLPLTGTEEDMLDSFALHLAGPVAAATRNERLKQGNFSYPEFVGRLSVFVYDLAEALVLERRKRMQERDAEKEKRHG